MFARLDDLIILLFYCVPAIRFNPFVPDVHQRWHILKETYSWKFQVRVSMCGLLMSPRH